MSLALAFWIIMLVWLIFGFWSNRANLAAGGGNLILFFLLCLIGWKVFGAPLHS